MSTTKMKKDNRAPAKPPELKIGPFQGGVGVALAPGAGEARLAGRRERRPYGCAPSCCRSSASGLERSTGRFDVLGRRPVAQYTSHPFPSGSRK